MILTMNIEIVNETNRCKAHEQKILTEIFKQKTQNWKNELNKNVKKKWKIKYQTITMTSDYFNAGFANHEPTSNKIDFI